MKFVQLAKSLKEEGLAPIYLVEGEETFFRDHAVGSIRTACALNNPTLNDVRYEGETLKGDGLSAFAADLRTLPFFDERRLVRVYEYYPSAKDWDSVLKSYAASPSPTTVLVIVNAGSGKKGCDLKRKSGIVYVDCGKEKEEMLTRWLFGIVRRAGLEIDVDATGLMVRYCNLDAARMKLEVEKLRLILGHGGRIMRDTVAEYVAKDVEYRLFELTDAAARKNYSAFSEILHDLMEKGSDENAVLSVLTSYFRNLVEIGKLRGPDAEIGSLLGIPPFVVSKNRDALNRMGKERAQELYLKLYELSAGMRSGIYTKSGALSAAIAKIFFG